MVALTIFLVFLGIAGVMWWGICYHNQNISRKQAVQNGTNNDIDEED